MRSFYLPEADQPRTEATRERFFCARDGGLVSAQVGDGDTIVNSRLIQGRYAWELIQPVVDPTADRD